MAENDFDLARIERLFEIARSRQSDADHFFYLQDDGGDVFLHKKNEHTHHELITSMHDENGALVEVTYENPTEYSRLDHAIFDENMIDMSERNLPPAIADHPFGMLTRWK